MVDIKTLLPELRTLVQELAEDLLERATSVPEVDAFLHRGFDPLLENGRFSQSFEEWREDYLEQVAVAWVLACIFVRFIEDNELINECYIAGEGDRGKLADGQYEIFFRHRPHATDREYLKDVFEQIGKIPAASELFASTKTPLWAVDPSGDAARKLLRFFKEIDPEVGGLKRSFASKRKMGPIVEVYEKLAPQAQFLGDLYQDLSEHARKKYALLQTPEFIQQFILNRTLTFAIDEFGLKNLRLIDPACGSGHFLLGAFDRLYEEWLKHTDNQVIAAQNAFDSIYGVDLNPFAIAITRFRLFVAAIQACKIERLNQQTYAWKLNLAVGDSLLWGSKPTFDNERTTITQQLNLFEVDPIFAVEDPTALRQILGQGYHVVVGNPPYITVKDKAQNEAYRQRYSTCHQKFSLGVPFTQRFWELAIRQGERIKSDSEQTSPAPGYVGMITANSFMKREFGKKLIEEFFPKNDLTHVLDTSGAFIPGHGTPTVILFGRGRKPVETTVRAVLGIRGEPITPEDPTKGLVWKSIVSQIDTANSQDEFTSTSDVPRTTLGVHPWSIGGGGASELQEQISEGHPELGQMVTSIGFASFPGLDDAFVMDRATLKRHGVKDDYIKDFVYGEIVRDWGVDSDQVAFAPYDDAFALIPFESESPWHRFLWVVRTPLESVVSFGGRTRKDNGDDWWGWYRWIPDKYRVQHSLTFAEVASHNHFVLDRGGKVFKQTAPIIKLPAEATEGEHLALLGLLNSSTACFWMKQVSHQKQMMGGDGIRISSRAKVPYQFAGTRLLEFPVPHSFSDGTYSRRLNHLAQRMDQLSHEVATFTAKGAIELKLRNGSGSVVEAIKEFEARKTRIRSEMVFLQEEIDFTCYVIWQLADSSLLCDQSNWLTVTMDAGMRPFEILQQRNLDDFVVPKDVPMNWPEVLRAVWHKRVSAIRNSKELTLIEDDHYKRRWIGRQGLFNHSAQQDELSTASAEWLLDRLESHRYWPDPKSSGATPQTTAQIADKASSDHDFMEVAALYKGRADFDLGVLVADLVTSESVPFLPVLRYKIAGLRKREVWERTWELQRKEDAGEAVGTIPVPPKYASADFLKTDYWRMRGKLDVPKERWISYPHCSTESDPSLLVGWAGWNHLEQATALVGYYDARKREGWDAKRLTPLLAGLDQLLPWIHQWHPEIDPEFGETAGQSYQTMLTQDAHELGLTLEDIRAWEPPATTTRTRRARAK